MQRHGDVLTVKAVERKLIVGIHSSSGGELAKSYRTKSDQLQPAKFKVLRDFRQGCSGGMTEDPEGLQWSSV